METTLQKISRKTGKKPVQCKCQACRKQCQTCPCLPTPEDVGRLLAEGYGDRLRATEWRAGQIMGVTNEVIYLIAPEYDEGKGACTFYNNGLCELHDSGLKPTEGKLSSHVATASNFNPKKSIAWAVAKEWFEYTEEDIESLLKNTLLKTSEHV